MKLVATAGFGSPYRRSHMRGEQWMYTRYVGRKAVRRIQKSTESVFSGVVRVHHSIYSLIRGESQNGSLEDGRTLPWKHHGSGFIR